MQLSSGYTCVDITVDVFTSIHLAFLKILDDVTLTPPPQKVTKVTRIAYKYGKVTRGLAPTKKGD